MCNKVKRNFRMNYFTNTQAGEIIIWCSLDGTRPLNVSLCTNYIYIQFYQVNERKRIIPGTRHQAPVKSYYAGFYFKLMKRMREAKERKIIFFLSFTLIKWHRSAFTIQCSWLSINVKASATKLLLKRSDKLTENLKKMAWKITKTMKALLTL